MQSRELLSGRLGALAGVAFAILLFFSTAMVDQPVGQSDAEVLQWWSDDGNLTSVIVSTHLQLAASVCFLVFLVALRAVCMRTEGGAGSLSTLAFAAGVLFLVAIIANAGPRGAIAFGVKMDDEPLPGVDTIRFLTYAGRILLGPAAALTIATSMFATAALILRTRAFGRWLGILGIVCGVGSAAVGIAAGPWFIPLALVWTLATSVGVWMASASRQAAEPGPQGALGAPGR
jgi:hypothetical protein